MDIVNFEEWAVANDQDLLTVELKTRDDPGKQRLASRQHLQRLTIRFSKRSYSACMCCCIPVKRQMSACIEEDKLKPVQEKR